LLIVVVLAALFTAGALPRLQQAKERSTETAAMSEIPTVYTELVKKDTMPTKLELPASIVGLHETALYARTNGYVKSLRVDIGSTVRAGDTLATLDMPEIGEQLRQARAVAEQTEATAALARATLARWRSMAEKDAVTKQELDEKQAAANVAEANLRAAHANVANLSEVLRFGALVAPFSGVVTSRSIDVGTLVSSGAVTGNRPLFTMTQTDTLRAMVGVPQSAAGSITVGQKAEVVIRDVTNTPFPGKVALTARAIDPTTRAMMVEVHIANPQHRAMPGAFSRVTFTVPAAGLGIRIPAIALIIRGDGPQVARVEGGKIHLTKLTLGRDFGTTVEVLSGIEPGAEVVINPSEQIADGAMVKPIRRGTKPAAK
jgi:RND family efflux transporter MFP subunit